MNILNNTSRILSFFACLSLLISIGCEQKKGNIKDFPVKNVKNKIQKTTPNIYTPKPIVIDSLFIDSANAIVTNDSIAIDSLKNPLQEFSKSLNPRYFRKSFSLHKKAFVALNGLNILNPCTRKNCELDNIS